MTNVRTSFAPAMAALLAMGIAAPARAQGFGTPADRFSTRPTTGALGRPTVSPYLNLLRSNNSPVLNYYGLVRPEQSFYASEARMQSEILRLDEGLRRQQLQRSPTSRLGATGHQSRFMTDLTGPSEAFAIEMQGRRTRAEEQFLSKGYSSFQSGHSARFGNTGFYYQKR